MMSRISYFFLPASRYSPARGRNIGGCITELLCAIRVPCKIPGEKMLSNVLYYKRSAESAWTAAIIAVSNLHPGRNRNPSSQILAATAAISPSSGSRASLMQSIRAEGNEVIIRGLSPVTCNGETLSQAMVDWKRQNRTGTKPPIEAVHSPPERAYALRRGPEPFE
jgi:hypothetical protein